MNRQFTEEKKQMADKKQKEKKVLMFTNDRRNAN